MSANDPAPPVPGGASGERCVHCGQTPSDPGASMCQIDGVSTGKLHDFRPGGGTGQRPGGWVEGIGWVVRSPDLQPGDKDEAAWVVTPGEFGSPFYSLAVVVRWADGQIPSPPASPVPPTPTPQPERDKIEIDIEGLLIGHCGIGGTSALTDRILALTDAYAARPSSGTDAAP